MIPYMTNERQILLMLLVDTRIPGTGANSFAGNLNILCLDTVLLGYCKYFNIYIYIYVNVSENL